MADYSTERIFALKTDQPKGFSSRKVDLGETGFSFSAFLPDDMEIQTGNTDVSDEPIVRIFDPKRRNAFMIEVHRVEFPAFAEALAAGRGFLALHGYNRIINDASNSNAAFGYLAATTFDEVKGYGRMARLASITRGRDVLFIYSVFDYDDYPEYEDIAARFLGSLQFDTPGSPASSLREVEARGGELFLVPRGWTLSEMDMTGKNPNATDYSLTSRDKDMEYPDLLITVRPVNIEEGRKLGKQMIDDFTSQIEKSSHAAFTGPAEMETYKSETGRVTGYAYARGWDTKAGANLVSEFLVQQNRSGRSVSIIGMNAYDVRRNIGSFDPEARDIIFKSWVTAVSAYVVARVSLHDGIEQFKLDLDIRALGH